MTAAQEKSTMPAPPPWTTQEPEKVYHARSKSGEFMSSGMLKTFRACAYTYKLTINGLIEDKDSTAYRFGRAAHKMILEGPKEFKKSFGVGGPINPKTGKTYGSDSQKYAEWLAANGLSAEHVVTGEESEALAEMYRMVANHPQASAILEFGWPELVARGGIHGVPCQIRMDWLTNTQDGSLLIVDLKTVEDITWFQTDAYRYEYPHQFAFYRDLCQAVTGEPCGVAVIVVEKKAPFRVGVWQVPTSVLDLHSAKNRVALEKFKECQVTDTWPTGYEDLRAFPMPKIGA